jgi:hypothetical protein
MNRRRWILIHAVTALLLMFVPRGLHAQSSPGGDGRTLTPSQGETIEACYRL